MNKKLLIPMALAVAFIMLATPVLAEVVTNEVVPLDMFVSLPNGDLLHMTGYLHILDAVTLDGKGGFHLKSHFNPQQVKGTSLYGYEYVGNGVTQWETNGKVGVEYTYVNVFNMIGKGQAPNLKVHEDVHFTVLPDGTVTSYHDHFRVTFK